MLNHCQRCVDEEREYKRKLARIAAVAATNALTTIEEIKDETDDQR